MSMCSAGIGRIKNKPTHQHIRHDEYISPGPTVKNTKKYTKVIIQEKHSILYFQTRVMKTLRTTAARRIGQKQRLTTFFHPLYLWRISRTETLAGARISNTATSRQRPFHRWCSIKDANVLDNVRNTERRPRFDWHHFYLLTGTCTISRKAAGTEPPGSVRQSCTACSCCVHAGQPCIVVSAMQKPKCYIS